MNDSIPRSGQPDSRAAPHAGKRRSSRWGLYLPLGLLALVVAGWSAFWFLAKGMVGSGVDKVITEAAQRGDVWICANRSISGYPFRLVVRCSDVTLTRTSTAGIVSLSTGPLIAIGQPHTPSHIIVQADGPLRAELADGRKLEARWELAEASQRLAGGQLERLSFDVRKPVMTISGTGGTTTLSSAALEGHVRRSTARPAEDMASDLFVKVRQLASGDLDALLGDANPSDVDVQITGNRLDLLSHGITATTLEAWRISGGKLDLTRLALKKGIKQIEARGELQLDDQRRISGRIEPSVANIDQFAGIRLRGGAMDLASALSGRAQPSNQDGLKPLPAIDLRGGRVSLGPVRLPLAPLQPLY